MGSIVDKNQLANICQEARSKGLTVVTTNGCFDILHVGHVRILKEARALGDLLVIGLNSDASVKRLKGPDRPLNKDEDRAEILASLACVDYVFIFEEQTPIEFLKIARPNIHVKGSDYKPSDLAETPLVESWGGRVEIIALVPGKSTTSLVQKICKGSRPE